MNQVAIIGVGHTKFGKLEDKDLMDLLCDVSLEAIEDSNTSDKDFDSVYVASMLAETLNHITGVASALVDRLNPFLPDCSEYIRLFARTYRSLLTVRDENLPAIPDECFLF